jgi:hypothetical protein
VGLQVCEWVARSSVEQMHMCWEDWLTKMMMFALAMTTVLCSAFIVADRARLVQCVATCVH